LEGCGADCLGDTKFEGLKVGYRLLEEIVRTMERGELPLEQSLQLFEEGTALVRSCGKLLDEAELKIVKLMKGSDGEPVELEFQDEP